MTKTRVDYFVTEKDGEMENTSEGEIKNMRKDLFDMCQFITMITKYVSQHSVSAPNNRGVSYLLWNFLATIYIYIFFVDFF